VSGLFNKDGPDKDLPDEQQLDEYLRGGSAVSQQYRQLPSADVPAEVDRLVLRQAQEAVKARPAKSRTWARWTGPLALAASAVLVVSIVIESGVHKETYLAAPASAPAEMTVMQEAAEQPAAGNAAEERALDADEAQDKPAVRNARDASVVHILPVQPATMADLQVDEVPPPAVSFPPVPLHGDMRPVAPPLASAAPQFTSPAPDAPVHEAPAELARAERANAIPQGGARTSAPAPAPVSARAQAREADASVEEVVMTGARRREKKQTVGPRNTIAAPAADSGSSAVEQEDETRNYTEPEQWLSDIRQLRKENKHEAADREWRRFRQVFPNYAVAEADPARGGIR
jgi:hypothetical protein